ncbi:hypothetical protein MNBD_ALPHA01-1208 [hydrothermal vent metagenome]|uniref:Salt-induced outer membrane protein n=1 Tax=hydrothermal vent metagenome TaxID=652676 RepID=A0A3B0SXV2_9ZZZZ
MPFTFKTALAAIIFAGITSVSPLVAAQISPDILNLLIVASEKDGGKNLDLVAELAISANPGAEKDIRELVSSLKQNLPEPETAVARPVAEPAPQITAEAPPKVVEEKPGFFDFRGWDGEVELNFLRSSGNTRQESLGLGGKLKRDADKFHHMISGFFDLNKNTGIKDKQRWGLSYKLDYDFSEKLYLTGFSGYENDQFGAFRERITTSIGIGYPIISNDSYSWKVEGGPSVLFTKDLPGDGYSSSINAFASSIFDWTINDRSEFTNTTVLYFGSKSVIESKTALKVKINGALSSKLSYDILYDRDAPPGRKRTDTVARAGLLYDF